jgi:hypothetical protein
MSPKLIVMRFDYKCLLGTVSCVIFSTVLLQRVKCPLVAIKKGEHEFLSIEKTEGKPITESI